MIGIFCITWALFVFVFILITNIDDDSKEDFED